MMVCGRCGGRLYFAGTTYDLDWWGCLSCANHYAEQDPGYYYQTEAQAPRKTRKLRQFKNQWFASGKPKVYNRHKRQGADFDTGGGKHT